MYNVDYLLRIMHILTNDFRVDDQQVIFADLPEDVIQAYVDSGEPMDKAGGYGIQALGGTLVSSVQGCYFNVVGFPISKFCRQLRTMLLNNEEAEKVAKRAKHE